MIGLAFNKSKTFESEPVVIDGDLLKFSVLISIMAMYARNISSALGLMSTVGLIFSVCARDLCVRACWGGGEK